MSFFPVHSGFDWGHHGYDHGYGHGNIVNNLVVRVDDDRYGRYYDGPYWGGRCRRHRSRCRSRDSDSSRSSRSSRGSRRS